MADNNTTVNLSLTNCKEHENIKELTKMYLPESFSQNSCNYN